ncbi:hypothetical protein [Lacihabitans lacunae]|uniref:Lipoprotein n=1 Tax=Lacihabitans lacunae TaxID=1028214 RepID=A0ABV7YTL5_9BACT
MRTVKFILLFILTGVSCKKTEIITQTLIPCDCKGLPIIIERKGVKGIIMFPNNPKDSYGILIPEFGGGDISPYFSVCNDSIFTNLIKIKKIADSTIVKVDGGVIDRDAPCPNKMAFRISNLEKVK